MIQAHSKTTAYDKIGEAAELFLIWTYALWKKTVRYYDQSDMKHTWYYELKN